MNGHRAVAVAMVLLIFTCAGCSGSLPGQGARRPAGPTAPGHAGRCPPVPSAQPRGPGPWPSRAVLREVTVGAVAGPAAGALFLLAPMADTPVRGPWVLCRVSLATGGVRRGPAFPAGGLTMASGYLWVYGARESGSRPVVSEVDPATMERIRAIPLPPVPAGFGGVPVEVAAGPAGSVWIGSYRTLLRVSAATGTPLARVTLPPGLAIGTGGVSADPAGAAVYVSAAHVVRGGMDGLVVLEYSARSGRELAAAAGGLIRYSVAGATLTAVPGGVWASFRTGNLGLTIHLGAEGLHMIPPPGPGIAQAPAAGVFHWPMDETTAYGGGALWVASQAGIVACLDPRTGAIRASERIPGSQLIYQFGAIDPAARTVYARQPGGLLRLTPPRRCWKQAGR